MLGALNNAVPFWLLGFAETHLDSGLTAVIQAAAPIFTVILASRMDVSQRVTGPRLIGVGVGFVGVALLVGVQRAATSSPRSPCSASRSATPPPCSSPG